MITNNNIIYISDILDELPDTWDYKRNQAANVVPESTPAGSHKILNAAFTN